MASYRIELKRSAAREIGGIPNKELRQQIVGRIAKLADDPRPVDSQKLSGQEAYRIRQGNYRIIYTIEDDRLTVVVVKVGHRRDMDHAYAQMALDSKREAEAYDWSEALISDTDDEAQ